MAKNAVTLNRWKEKLLDLSLNNKALNHKSNKSGTIQIISPDLKTFFEKIVPARSTYFARLFDHNDDDLEDEEQTLKRTRKEEIKVLGQTIAKKDFYESDELAPIIEAYKNKRSNKHKNELFTNLSGPKQTQFLRHLMKTATFFKEENAVDVLFFAIGYLKWYDEPGSKRALYAPLMFMNAELSQKSFDAAFEAKLIDDELLINHALIRKMKVDYGLDLEFPEIKEDATIYEVYQQYKAKIEEALTKFSDKRWEVLDHLELATFSFTKINLVKDLEDNEKKILASDFYQKLTSKKQQIADNDLVRESQVDEYIDPKNYFHKLDADSSQEAAIQSAILGKSFVLEGPPGTGKSQTITNIITELIARGKKVLFVAEKKAALDVVWRNLNKIGLGAFALPIHDSDFDKKGIVKDLYSTLLKGTEDIPTVPQFYAQDKIHRYKNTKADLNDYYAKILEIRKPLNHSLYELYGLFAQKDKIQDIFFDIEDVQNIDQDQLFDLQKKIETLQNKVNNIDVDFKANPWYGFFKEVHSTREKEHFKNLLNSVQKDLKNLEQYLELNVKNRMHIYFKDNAPFIETLKNLVALLDHIRNAKTVDERIKRIYELPQEINILEDILIEFKTIEGSKLQLSKKYKLEVLNNFQADRNYLVLEKLDSGVKRTFSSEWKKIKNDLDIYRHESKPTYEELLQEVKFIRDIQEKMKNLELLSQRVTYTKNLATLNDIENALYDLKWYQKFIHLSKDVLFYNNDSVSLAISWVFNKDNIFPIIDESVQKARNVLEQFDEIQSYFDKDKVTFDNLSLKMLKLNISTYISHFNSLSAYSEFITAYIEVSKSGLKEFADLLLESKIRDNYYEIFLKRFYALLIEHYLEESDLNFGYNGEAIQVMKEEFGEVEKEIQKIAELKVTQNLYKNLPNLNSIEGLNASVKILAREATKDRRTMPFRLLFERIPELILMIKPCLMMSPLTVSSFLKTSPITFDTVIFDEASQVFPENAVGALFRANQHIIVGDEHQLPPTNFFNADGADEALQEDERGETDDYESILNAAKGFLPTIRLKWHYRSKFEELILPSNVEIYNDNLITFPSLRKPKSFEGIQFMKVDGHFVNNQNEVEAETIVKLIKTIYEKYGTTKSVGVVSFNKKQQVLIEQKLNKLRRTDSSLEPFFSRELKDPFFVKNIETVQGDERDIIIMSICYGPNEKGHFAMRFGPINQQQGYKRLNVATTRAKECTILVSSITQDDIDLNKTEARGVRFLKQYLLFAEYGESKKVVSNQEKAKQLFEAGFEKSVLNELQKLGYEVKMNVGNSGYKIDLAIVDPENRDKFVVGIECDGATYQSSKSARDRDRLREEVLEMRGWQVYRIWSTDWFKNKEQQVIQLDNFIKKAIEDNKFKAQQKKNSKKESIANSKKLELINKQTAEEKEDETKETIVNEIPVVHEKRQEVSLNEIFKDYPNVNEIDPKNFVNKQAYITGIIKALAPVLVDDVIKLSPMIFEKPSLTKSLKTEFNTILNTLVMLDDTIAIKDDFIFDSTPGIEIEFRKTVSEETKRKIPSISYLEIASGIYKILTFVKETTIDALYKQFADYCLYSTVTPKLKALIDEAINYLVNENKVTLDDKVLKIK
ncbi:DUF4011 domain-containing protein [Mycoplasmopsis gallopavonis]|uniref:Putative DNA helicase n=1 Tax=Mycoplasmopsis gallopavonis TaxID=76629 RepID=A0A449AYI0_9BACT|nr:DUF4011 domain-containing protein [Mycoplasmopsis gallopavonis]RIV16501.1 DUF4011 domain-containing protein [Mycoplasmopsis gallopavonis]VEU72598.1 putative DNA helicase [Mycoplasmopsis gallopavonis]